MEAEETKGFTGEALAFAAKIVWGLDYDSLRWGWAIDGVHWCVDGYKRLHWHEKNFFIKSRKLFFLICIYFSKKKEVQRLRIDKKKCSIFLKNEGSNMGEKSVGSIIEGSSDVLYYFW